MNATQIEKAREMLGFTQPELAKAIGWTTKRNVINLENPTNPKNCTLQTALSIECLLRRKNLWEQFVKTDWWQGLSVRNKDGLTRLKLFDMTEVEKLVNNSGYDFPVNSNMGKKSKQEIQDHIAKFN